MQRHNCNAMVHGLQCDSIMQMKPVPAWFRFSYMQRHNCYAMVHGLQFDSIMQMKPVPAWFSIANRIPFSIGQSRAKDRCKQARQISRVIPIRRGE
jgi:copper(I)-binding protein